MTKQKYCTITFLSASVCVMCLCVCLHICRHRCVGCTCRDARLTSGIIPAHSSMLFVDVGSLNQTQSSQTQLVLLAALFWGSSVSATEAGITRELSFPLGILRGFWRHKFRQVFLPLSLIPGPSPMISLNFF